MRSRGSGLEAGRVWDIKVDGVAISRTNKRFWPYQLLSTEPRALASGLLQVAWRPLANARGSVLLRFCFFAGREDFSLGGLLELVQLIQAGIGRGEDAGQNSPSVRRHLI